MSIRFTRCPFIQGEDIDGDGDIDILACGEAASDVIWWENDGSQNFTRHHVEGAFGGGYCVIAADLDDDHDNDLIAAAQNANKIIWWENALYRFRFKAEIRTGHAPLTVKFQDLSTCFEEITIRAWDFDNDGTIDSNEPNPTWTSDKPGVYSICLEVSNDSISKKIVFEDYIHVFDVTSALPFNGKDSYVSCPAAPGLNLTEAMTIEAWIHPHGWDSVPNLGFGRIIDKQHISTFLIGQGGGLNSHSLAIWLSTSNGISGFINTPENSISLDEWQHVAVTYYGNQNELKMYIDGIEQPIRQASGQLSGNISDNSNTDLLIGNSASRLAFDGIIDEVRIWNIVRSAEQIQTNMNLYLRGNQNGLVEYSPSFRSDHWCPRGHILLVL